MYLSKILHLGLLLLFSLIASSIHADQNDPLEIIDLNNRPAEEMIPIIKAMLKPNDAITGTGFQLFLRTDEKTLEEVTRLLQVMDRAPRSLIISVRNNVDIGSESSDFNYSGNYEIGGDTRVVAGERPPHDKGKRVRTNNSKRSLENNSKHMVRVTESRKAFIIAGEIRSYENRTIIRHRYGVSVYESIDYQDITSGFYVPPKLTGNGDVLLQVQPHYRSVSDKRSGSTEVHEAYTMITAKLGQWVQIGGIDIDTKSKDKGFLSTSRFTTDTQSSIYIKVEVEPTASVSSTTFAEALISFL